VTRSLEPAAVALKSFAVLAAGFVEHRDVRLDLLIIDQPSERFRGAVAGIGGQRAAGSTRDTYFAGVSLAPPPKAASSSTVMYCRTARLAFS
jgi:hypothetical protein